MAYTIYIIGCGNIGSRHLQAIALLPYDMHIHIVDPSAEAKALAQQRFEELMPQGERIQLSWHDRLPSDTGHSDLTIVATSSRGRVALVLELLGSGHRRFIIEKMVTQSKEQYAQLEANLVKYNAKAWVNTARRYFGAYRQIVNRLSADGPAWVSVTAGNMGLGCNAIHFIDLFQWFAQEQEVTLSGDYLYRKLFDNKRGKELIEFAGTLMGRTPNGSVVNVTFLPYDNPTLVSLSSQRGHVLIDETSETLTVLRQTADLGDLSYRNSFVSETTAAIITDILDHDTCDLPETHGSAVVHHELFRIFNQHIKLLTGEEPALCPIT